MTKVSYFKGNDPSQWKTNIPTYDVVSLGEVYDGIELKLKAYGNNVEKLFCVKPDANPEQIKISLSGIQPSENPPPLSPSVRGTGACPPLAGAGGGMGARGLWVNEHGELVAETELGAVKFTKPIAYQEINGKRVDVECKYTIADCGMQNAECKTNLKYEFQNPKYKTDKSNPKSAIHNPKLQYGFKVASYDKSHDLTIDPLLASTYLGGNGIDYGYSLALDTSGNVYVTGYTGSSDFPTTSGAYETSRNITYSDIFVSKLDGGLTSLLASTYLGGSSYDWGYALAIDTSGNVYVTGETRSTNFPTTSGAYDTSFNGSDSNVFVSRLDGNLSASPPAVTTGNATNVTSSSAKLNGTLNANGLSTTAWFNYGTSAGSYNGTSTTQSVSGSSDTLVSIGIGGLSPGTTYYYRIAAQNITGITYGDEMSFITLSDTSGSQGSISGYVIDIKDNPIGNAKVRLKRGNIAEKTVSDEDGFFEFEDPAAGTYVVIVTKRRYKISRKTVKLKDNEDIEIEIKIKMKKQ